VQRARVVNVPRWAFLIVAAQAGGDEEDDDGDDEEDDGARTRLGREPQRAAAPQAQSRG
jgi:hypothetical protein